ncbi:MAG: FkbM family methyltransferase [Candidatus Magasanikbacteria bacterium]
MSQTRQISYNNKTIQIISRDQSDESVIDEFFVDKMYRSVEKIIPSVTNPIIDIGAHIGVFSLYARILNLSVQIIALEPHPDNMTLFQENMSLNNISNVQLLPYALTDTDETTAKLFISENTHNHTTSPDHLTLKSFEQISVPAITLEKLIQQNKIDKIGLLKLDIEGAEFTVLNNIQDTWNKIQSIVVEYHEVLDHNHAELEQIMRENGFSVEHFPSKFEKRFGLLVGRNKRYKKIG